MSLLILDTSGCRVVVQGPGPGPRYGHVMALVGQRFLLAIGGNDGRQLYAVDIRAFSNVPYKLFFFLVFPVFPLNVS